MSVAAPSVRPARPRSGVSSSHAGLSLARHLARTGEDEKTKEKARRALLDEVITAAPRALEVYRRAHKRWRDTLPSTTAIAEAMRTVDPVIVGLGAKGVTEIGITLHHTYGVPMLPGTALKGLAAHYCHTVWGAADGKFLAGTDEEPAGEHHRVLFGTVEESGVLVFHDGWIRPDSVPKALRLDVMTPHHTKYYMEGKAPTDFDSPVPVTFLSVKGEFDVAVSVEGNDERAREWANLGLRLLKDALADWGVGGKTSSGYGRLIPGGGGK